MESSSQSSNSELENSPTWWPRGVAACSMNTFRLHNAIQQNTRTYMYMYVQYTCCTHAHTHTIHIHVHVFTQSCTHPSGRESLAPATPEVVTLRAGACPCKLLQVYGCRTRLPATTHLPPSPSPPSSSWLDRCCSSTAELRGSGTERSFKEGLSLVLRSL